MDNNTRTDYEILANFLRLTTHRENIDDISIRKYIKYYCDIHIDHVIQNFLPAKMFNDITGGRHDWSMTKNMILREVIENLQTANKHLTVGDFYKDIFLMTAPFGLNESGLPKIRPSEASKQILSDLCNPQLVAKYFGDNQSDIIYKKTIPENAIDRFFYKIGRGTKNTGKTIAESEVVGKTVGFLFRDPWGPIVALFLMALAIGGVFTLLGFE